MLSNRLTSTQNVSSLIVLLLLIVSCSSSNNRRVTKRHKTYPQRSECEDLNPNVDQRVLVMAAKHNSKKLSHCFANYMRFESNKKQSIRTCNVITVNKYGKVTYAYTRGMKGKIIPKDLKMCMEQDLWSMHLKGLQLGRGYTIKFPISFKSI